MKTRIIILTLTIIGCGNLYAQNITDSLMLDFYNKTFNDYFSKESKRDTLTKDFYILKDASENSFVPKNTRTDYENFKLHFVSWLQAYSLVEEGKTSSLFWIRKYVDTDTLGIVIEERHVGIKRINKKNAKCLYSEIPIGLIYMYDAMLIYDKKLKEWKYMTREEILKEIKEKCKTENETFIEVMRKCRTN